jgi:hypothetical protein
MIGGPPGSGEEVEQAFDLDDGEWDESEVGRW